MLCDLYAFEAAFHPRPSSEIQSNGGADIPFFSDPCYFPDYEETFPSPAPIYPSFCCFSPPRISSQDLSLYYSKSMQPLPNVPNLETEFENSSVLKVKSQECEMGNQYLVPQRYSGTDSETESKLMKQLPYETPCFQNQGLSSLDHPLFDPQMRRVCGTGDLQNIHETHSSHTEKTSCKVGRNNAKERKEKMSRNRAKRSKRNFNKTTKNLVPQSYSGTDSENVPKLMMQPPAYETPCFQSQALSSPYHTLFNPQMRRVCRNGDSKNIQETHTSQNEKASFKVGRYSAEERKERIAKYRAKKSKRNFNKTIKYECRKTLADKRRRVRGKFSRDDETSDIPNPKP